MVDRDSVIAAKSAVTASENFEGESVVIHFTRGTYFSLRAGAGAVWSLLQRPTSVAAIVEAVAAAPGDMLPGFETSLTAFIAKLTEHDLIAEVRVPAEPLEISREILAGLSGPFEIEVYNDLAELIAMDPVHEVDILTGWPERPYRDIQHG